MNASRFYSTRTAAEMLGVSLRTVQLWVESGRLPAWKTDGGHRRIPAEVVDRMVSEQISHCAVEVDRPFRVLVVEDDEHLLRIYCLTLESVLPPIEVLEARNGYDGLLQIGKCKPDLVILDLNMPGMDGFRLCRTVLEMQEFRSTEIVVVTSLDKQAIVDRGGLPPSIRVFPKPVPMSVLLALVATTRSARENLSKVHS